MALLFINLKAEILFFIGYSNSCYADKTLLLPLYRLISRMKLMNTYTDSFFRFWYLPLQYSFRQYVVGIPDSLVDAAELMDVQSIVFLNNESVMLPAYGAMAVLLAMNNWNSFIWPLLCSQMQIYSSCRNCVLKQPYSTNYKLMISGSALTVIPIILYFLFPKIFYRWPTSGSIKG